MKSKIFLYQTALIITTFFKMQKKCLLLFILACLLYSLNSYSQPELWGMTSAGGESNIGVIFKTDINGNNYSVEYSFLKFQGTSPRHVILCEASNGKLYGTTSGGDLYGNGIIFEYDPSVNSYTKKIDFIDTIGIYPSGSLIEASNGKLYGMTIQGGINDDGVLFEYDFNSNILVKKVDFELITKGRSPASKLIEASNGKLYGMTKSGGVNRRGVLFEFDPATNGYSIKIDFIL